MDGIKKAGLNDIQAVLPKNWQESLKKQNFEALSLAQAFDLWLDTEDEETLPVAWPALRMKFGGLRLRELTVVTGDTGHGKTTFCVNWFYFLATQQLNSMIFSLETGPISIIKKLFQMQSSHLAKKDNAFDKYPDFMKWAQKSSLYILNHMGFLEYEKLKMAVYWAAKYGDCKAILIDHFHSFTRPGLKADEMESMIMELKTIAYNMKIAIMLICHPSKIQGDRKEREIQMDDLKGSSGLKQYADNVLSVYYDKPNSLTKLRLHKIRDDKYGQNAGVKITYSMNKNLLFEELDDGAKD